MVALHRRITHSNPRQTSNLFLLAAALSIACSGSDGSSEDHGPRSTGGVGSGARSSGGNTGRAGSSGQNPGGTAGLGDAAGASVGGMAAGSANAGGTSSAGGGAAGNSPGGMGAGGTNAGGTSSGGVNAGGTNAGGTSAGGTSSAGRNTGGGTSAGGSGAGGATSSSCGVTPVDPSATPAAKKLLCYLYGQYKNHVLSGQQETSWASPVGDIDFYQTNTGKYPAILGGDFLYLGTNPSSQGTTTSRAQAYWEAGGIPMIRYHMGAPPNADSYENSMLGYSSTQCNNVVTAGTSENTSYKSKLDSVAGNLLTLQTAGVAVILALFHETQPMGWFWWSKCSSSQFLALYKYSYDYLVITKGVHNVLRLMPFSGSPNASFYPGKAQVDLTGPDTYATNPPFANMFSSTAAFIGSTMPIALHETGVITQPSTMFPSAAPWLMWNVWAGYQKSNNTLANIKSAYSSSYTVTRDEVPSFK